MKIGLTLWIGAIALVVAVWIFPHPGDLSRADPRDAKQIALGEAVYLKHCASCHGQRLEGQPDWRSRNANGRLPAPPHDETGHTWHHSDDQLFRITKYGLAPPIGPPGYESDMPAYGDVLTDDQIWAVLAFIKSRWPQEIRDRQSRLNQGDR